MSHFTVDSITGEVEIQGSEAFVESNFHHIQAKLAESFGEKQAAGTGQAAAPETVPAVAPAIKDTPPAPKVPRPPVRKYFNALGKLIRSEDTSVSGNQATNVLRHHPKEISVASLKAKFGLSEKQVEEIIRDAERQGRVKRDQDGSYVWL
ncbi:MAG: hypothetical protein AB1558_01180 [Thermodesulfobacteriota bacterium]